MQFYEKNTKFTKKIQNLRKNHKNYGKITKITEKSQKLRKKMQNLRKKTIFLFNFSDYFLTVIEKSCYKTVLLR